MGVLRLSVCDGCGCRSAEAQDPQSGPFSSASPPPPESRVEATTGGNKDYEDAIPNAGPLKLRAVFKGPSR